MSSESMEAELARLREENEKLKTQKTKTKDMTFKVSQKGALSVYGMGRFPVTLYKEQWVRLLDKKEDLLSFIADHESELKGKGE
jgi:ribosome-interacting GTPase 1